MRRHDIAAASSRGGTSHVATEQRCKYTALVDIENAPCKTCHSFTVSSMRLECSESTQSEAEKNTMFFCAFLFLYRLYKNEQ